jgi:hypothetical protein
MESVVVMTDKTSQEGGFGVEAPRLDGYHLPFMATAEVLLEVERPVEKRYPHRVICRSTSR